MTVNLHGFLAPSPQVGLAETYRCEDLTVAALPPRNTGLSVLPRSPRKIRPCLPRALSHWYAKIPGGASDWPSLGPCALVAKELGKTMCSVTDYSDGRGGPDCIHFIFSPNRKEIQTMGTEIITAHSTWHIWSSSGQSSELLNILLLNSTWLFFTCLGLIIFNCEPIIFSEILLSLLYSFS